VAVATPKRRKSTAPPVHPVTQYALDVVEGRVLAGRPVRLACQRHLNDLEHGSERGLWFDDEAATRVITFFSHLCLSEGEHAGKPFTLQPWQQFVVGCLFGWKGADGYRRFRYAYVEIGKGNGKSPMAAGIGLYMLCADGEASAEVYTAAVTRDQARISFRDAQRMVEASAPLAKRINVLVNNLSHDASGSFMRPLSSEGRSLDGKRPHNVIIDELHEHPNSNVVDKMRAGTKGRRQALIVGITNSGYDRKSVCFQQHTYSLQILEGALANDAWFAYVCQLDVCEECRAAGKLNPTEGCPDCDDWRDEAVWLKPNPNLGVSITLKYLREQVAEAIGMPAKSGIVMRLNFCIWTQQLTKWLPLDRWSTGSLPRFSRESLKGRRCFGGLDLARVHDLSAFALVFPPAEDGERWKALLRFWCPEDDLPLRSQRDRVPYDLWVREEWIEATDGNTTDFDFIEARVVEDAEYFKLAELAYDRAFADSLVQTLQDAHGLTMVPFGQGFLSMAAPTAELERMVRAGELHHGGNPVLDWMASNVVVRSDPAGNLKPDKEMSPERIDGIVALIMALGRAKVGAPEEVSRYATEDIRVWG
jgi:phage terminase large subunit-like protein